MFESRGLPFDHLDPIRDTRLAVMPDGLVTAFYPDCFLTLVIESQGVVGEGDFGGIVWSKQNETAEIIFIVEMKVAGGIEQKVDVSRNCQMIINIDH